MLAVAILSTSGESRQKTEPLPRLLFEERFTSQLDPRAWQADWGGGSTRNTKGLTELTAGADSRRFPILLTRADMLPTEGDWNVTVDFLAMAASQNGNGLSLRNLDTGHELFRVHLDQEQAAVQLWIGDGKHSVRAGSQWDGSPMRASIPSRGFCDRWLVEKRGKVIALVFNGQRLQEVTPESGRYSLRIGCVSNEQFNAGEWSRIAYGSIRIEYLTAKAPAWLN